MCRVGEAQNATRSIKWRPLIQNYAINHIVGHFQREATTSQFDSFSHHSPDSVTLWCSTPSAVRQSKAQLQNLFLPLPPPLPRPLPPESSKTRTMETEMPRWFKAENLMSRRRWICRTGKQPCAETHSDSRPT